MKFVDDDIRKNTTIVLNTTSPTYNIHTVVHVASFKNYIFK